MDDEQKALIVRDGPGGAHGLDVLNTHLRRGWRVQHVAPMGGAGAGAAEASRLAFAALVIIERSNQQAAGVVAEAEEEVDELIDDVVEGDAPVVPVEDVEIERTPPPPS